MRSKLIIILAVNCFVLLRSQTLEFSRPFVSLSRSLPITIINNHKNYFNVLRYNRLAHDFTIERRSKPNAEIINFTPLKLDSVNAKWFNYTHLDYLFFEHDFKLYFAFEKVLNNKKTLYLKIIDTLGKSSGFIEITSIERDKTLQDFDLRFQLTVNNNLLIITSKKFQNHTVKKVVSLFDLERKKITWTKPLPVETSHSGYSAEFECNSNNDLYFLMIKSHFISFLGDYARNPQNNVPVFMYDSLAVYCLRADGQTLNKQQLPLHDLSNLNNFSLKADTDGVFVQVQFSKKEKDAVETEPYFLVQKFNSDLSLSLFSKISPMKKNIKELLTFFDGTDQAAPGYKNYSLLDTFYRGGVCYTVCERKEEHFYKELLVWETSLSTGEVVDQFLIPRKILSSSAWSRYDKIGEATLQWINGKLCIYMLEAKSNFYTDPNQFNYNALGKKSNERNCNLVLYLLDGKTMQKKLLHANAEFNFIPVNNASVYPGDAVLYLNSGKQERFAILKLNPL